MLFFDNFVEKTSLQLDFSEKNIWLSLPIPRVRFDLPHKEKMLWCSYIRSFIKLTMFSDLEISPKKLISTPWKVIIPLGNSVEDPMRVIQMHLGICDDAVPDTGECAAGSIGLNLGEGLCVTKPDVVGTGYLQTGYIPLLQSCLLQMSTSIVILHMIKQVWIMLNFIIGSQWIYD